MQKVVEKPRHKAEPQIQAEVVTVTPGMAQAWLDRNISNRSIRTGVVAAYMRAMLEDRWTLSGDAIRFDTAGNLMDGQHRLNACVNADVPFKTMVIYNVPEGARETIDTNAVRTVADTLAMGGTKNAVAVAAAVRWLFMAKLGHGTAASLSGSSRLKMTTQEVRVALDNHPMLSSCVARVANLTPRVSGAQIPALAWILYVAERYLDAPALGAAFVEVFRSGVPSREGCPAHAFRERALRVAHSRERIRQEHMQIGLIHAWNLFSSGGNSSMFRIPQTAWIAGLDRKKIK